ncbi:J domain-containing protein [Arthrobacter sp. zg-Y1110]|uniref:J domain-containing protein n=1 Tax=Arthrobacter sp. zg-Y1110 TaxID=2886932 RepID=UPI001D13848A|nr:J domain-containing protein [Arthrobacter sp. zg-Y1110]MCC3292858.1 J domain-containing protein [Arthrobacter sp. zg-Y1110]UWX86796.1 J domain-containing protein [Arthrobacter sp. zg-Y1110]
MNSYEVLGVRPDATHDEIKKAYRALARRTHPDVGGDAMKPLFLSVTSAWESLSDPDKRAAYDRANGLGHPATPPPAPDPAPRADRRSGPDTHGEAPPESPDFEDFWAGAGPAGAKGPTRDTRPPSAPRKQAPAPAERSWREIFDTTVQRRRRHPLPVAIGVLSAAWAALLIFLGLKELILSGPEGVLPRGSGVLTYAVCWVAGTWHCSRQVRGGTGIGWGPLTAAGVGALTFWALNRAHLGASAAAVAAGLVLSLAVAAWLRRRINLREAGQGPGSPGITSFNRPDESPEEAEARRMTRRVLGELLKTPGTRVLENAPVRGRAVAQIIINGTRVAVVDSRILPDWVHEDLTGDLSVDGAKVIPNIETSIAGDVADVRSNVRSVRGWLIVHPSEKGSADLKPVRGVPVTAASPSEALEQIGAWLAEGPKAGLIDPDLAYRVIRGASPAVR